jgi:hypothetical protein
MLISETLLNNIVHSINEQLNLAGIDLNPEALYSLNDSMTSFFADSCNIDVKEVVSFRELRDKQQQAWMELARQTQEERGDNPEYIASEALDLAAQSLFLAHEGLLPVNVSGAEHSNSQVQHESKQIAAHTDSAKCCFTLKDDTQPSDNDITGYSDNGIGLGVSMYFNGYSDCCSDDNIGAPVYIEQYNGELRVLVYSDINQEEPTHVISMEGARNTKRLSE